jgi:hypothetical protein
MGSLFCERPVFIDWNWVRLAKRTWEANTQGSNPKFQRSTKEELPILLNGMRAVSR